MAEVRVWRPASMTVAVLLLAALAAPARAASFLVGLSPTDYSEAAPLDVLALNLFSGTVSVPYDYFSLPFCPASADATARAADASHLTLGQILLGQRSRVTAIELRMRRDVACAVSCVSSFSPAAATTLAKRIRHGYRARLTLDDMPVVVREPSRAGSFELGYALGYVQQMSNALVSANLSDGVSLDRIAAGRIEVGGVASKVLPAVARMGRSLAQAVHIASTPGGSDVFVYNHLDFTVMYHAPDDLESVAGSKGTLADGNSFRVVGFEVAPRSVRYPLSNPPAGVDEAAHCVSAPETPTGPQEPLAIDSSVLGNSRGALESLSLSGAGADPSASQPIKFTYSVKFVESKVKWVTRFDTLIKVSRGRQKIQVFAILNSLLLAVFITALFAIVLLRTLRRDCVRYGFSAVARSEFMDDFHDDFENDSGWRMLRGDVFRAPRAGSLLCVLCGSGMQLTLVMFLTLLFAMLGVISPGRRGQLVSSLIVLYALSSSVAGYVAASMHRAIGGSRWKLVTFGVALVLPGIAFFTFLVINFFLWAMGSIGAAPFGTLFLLLFLWLGVSVPLAFAGTYFGYMRKSHDYPVRTNQIPRQVPPQPKYLATPMVVLAAGAIPFGIVGIELRLVLKSIMEQEIYHMFAFLFAVTVLLAVTCAEVSVVLCYLRLSNEDWAWWWSSFWASGASGVYVLAFSVYSLATAPGTEPGHVVSNFLFLAYSSLFSLCFVLITGSIGCLSALTFVRRIFSVSSDD